MKKVSLPPEFHQNNRRQLIASIPDKSVVIIPANDELNRNGDQNYPYRQNSNLYYLTGIEQEKTILALCPSHPDKNLREVLFTIKPDLMLETWTGHKLTREETTALSGIKTVKWLNDFDMIVRDMVLHCENIYLNLNEYIKFQNPVSYHNERLVEYLKKLFPLHQYHRISPLLTQQRLIKKKEEIGLMQKACNITGDAFKRILQFVEPGVAEYEVEAEMIHEFIRQGARGHAYQPIVGSGANALVLHYTENNGLCQDGDLLLMDFGAEYGQYAADCSRTIPVNGKFTKRQRACYEAVLRVQKKATSLFVPGNTIEHVNKEVFSMMEEEMINLRLFSQKDVNNQDPANPLYFKFLMHGVNHFIGLDVHDVGDKYEPFKKGMVLTIEPGLYIKDENIGIRIENNIMVDDKPLDLMASIPREAEEIEEIMKKD